MGHPKSRVARQGFRLKMSIGFSSRILRPSWAIRGAFWVHPGVIFGHLGPLEGTLGVSEGYLGPSWGPCWAMLGSFLLSLMVLGSIFWLSLDYFEVKSPSCGKKSQSGPQIGPIFNSSLYKIFKISLENECFLKTCLHTPKVTPW